MFGRLILMIVLVLGLFMATGCQKAPRALSYQLDIETPIGPVSLKLNSKQVPTVRK